MYPKILNKPLIIIGFLIATALRLWFSLKIHPPGDFIFSDMLAYDGHAQNLRDRHLGPWDTFSPHGYPALLALIYSLSGKNFQWVAILQSLMGGATCVLAALISKRMSPSRLLPWVVMTVMTFYLPLIYYGGFLLTETFCTFALTLSIWLLFRLVEFPKVSRALAAGLSLSATALIRPNILLVYAVLPIYFAIVFWPNRKQAIGVWAKMLLFSLPLLLSVSVFNSKLMGKPVGLGTNGGLNFFLAHSDIRMAKFQRGTFHYAIGPIRNMLNYSVDFQSPVPLYDESFFYREGWKNLRENPLRLLKDLDNVREGIGLGKQDYWPHWEPWGKIVRLFSQLFFWAILLPLGFHLLWAWRDREPLRSQAAALPFTGLMILVVLVTMYVFLGDPRIHIPFDPLLIAAATSSWMFFSKKLRRPRIHATRTIL